MPTRKTRKNKLQKLRGGQSTSLSVTTVARSFNNPYGIAVDSSGTIYVADTFNNCIKKVTPAGVVTTLAGSTMGFSDDTGTAAKFNAPMGLAIDANGDIIVADSHNQRIRKITPEGEVTTIAGSRPVPGDPPPVFEYPTGVAVDSTGNIFVSDDTKGAILKVTPEGVVSTLAGGNPSFIYSDGQGTNAAFGGSIGGIAIDPNGNIFVADFYCDCIRKVTPTGLVTTIAGYVSPLNRPLPRSMDFEPGGYVDGTGLAAKFNGPKCLAIEANGNLIVTDQANNRIRRVTPAGVVTTIAGNGAAGTTDGAAMSASFNEPAGVAIDAMGNILIADSSNNRIRRINTSVSTTTAPSATTTRPPSATTTRPPSATTTRPPSATTTRPPSATTTRPPTAPPYNSTTVYKVGDVITGPDGKVYRMIDSTGGPGYPPPRPTNWALVTGTSILPATIIPTVISPGTYSFSFPLNCASGESRTITVTIA